MGPHPGGDGKSEVRHGHRPALVWSEPAVWQATTFRQVAGPRPLSQILSGDDLEQDPAVPVASISGHSVQMATGVGRKTSERAITVERTAEVMKNLFRGAGGRWREPKYCARGILECPSVHRSSIDIPEESRASCPWTYWPSVVKLGKECKSRVLQPPPTSGVDSTTEPFPVLPLKAVA